MKNLFLLSAASLFLFGCGTKVMVGNSTLAEITVNGKEIAAGQCEEVRVKGDDNLKVEGDGIANAETDPGETEIWIWSEGWAAATGNQCKEEDNDGNLVVNAPATPPAGKPAGSNTPPPAATGTVAGTQTATYQFPDNAPISVRGCDNVTKDTTCVKTGSPNTNIRLSHYTGDCQNKNKSFVIEYNTTNAAGETVPPTTEYNTVAEGEEAASAWVKKQEAAGYTCS